MIDLAKQTAPFIASWLQSAERDPSVDKAYISMLQDLERNPNLTKALVIAKDLASAGEARLLGAAALLLGTFDHPRAQGLLELVLKQNEPRLRIVALEAARLGRNAWGLRRCIAAIADKEPAVRERARELCRLWDAQTVRDLFVELLGNTDTASLTEAAQGLSLLADESTLDLIERAFGLADLSLKRKLARALYRMASPGVLTWTRGLLDRVTEPDGKKLVEAVVNEMQLALKVSGAAAQVAPSPGPAQPSGPPADSGLIRPGSPRGPAVAVMDTTARVAAPTGGGIPRPAELSAPDGPPVAFTRAHRDRITGLLKELVVLEASDLHLKAGFPPYVRRDGHLVPLPQAPIAPEELLACLASLTKPEQMRRYIREGDLDLSIGLPGVARFRLNFLTSRGVPGMVARKIPSDIPDLSGLGLPAVVISLAQQTRGLLLVTGPTGSGKSTTLAAMIDLINSTRKGHIITLEDPLEFLHRDKSCTITQREVGTDVPTFADGIRFAQRMDPDVILVGELRDLETLKAALHAAGAGRLVLATLHTNSAAKTVERIVNMFPSDAQLQARVNLALTLLAVVSQTLVIGARGGRLPVHEILIATSAIRKAIRDNQSAAIYAQIESGASQGMTTLEQSLSRLVISGQITREEAYSRASDPTILSMLLH